MPRYQLAIFDFDGTLADSFPWFCSVVNQTADKFRFSRVEDGEVEALRDLGVRAVMAHLKVPAWKLPQIAVYMRALQAQNIDQIRLFPGVAEMLAELHAAGTRLALVSSNAEANIRRVLGSSAELFEHYGCGSSLWGKPAKFRATLKVTGVTATAAICLGDEVRDIEAARKAGVAVGSVTYGYNSAAALRAAHPDHCFDHPSALAAALLQ